MTSPREDPTEASGYEELVAALSASKRLGYDAVRRMYLRLTPERWSDRLRKEQSSLLHRVESWSSWDVARQALDLDIAEVRVLWVGSAGCGGGYLTRFYLATYRGYCCAVNAYRLRGSNGDAATAVPRDLRRWISDDAVVKVVTDNAEELLSSPPYNLHFRCVVGARELYAKFARVGVIRTPWSRGEGSLEELLSSSMGYHHRPCSLEDWEKFVGESRCV